MFEIFLILIAIIGSLIAGLWDLKTTDIPDKVIYVMIGFAIILNLAESLVSNNFNYLINSFLVGGLFLLFGLLMYLTGQWGGGDGELLVAIGLLLPSIAFNFLINLFIVGGIYIITYSFIFAARNNLFNKFSLTMKGVSKLLISVFLLSLLFSIILYSISPFIASIPILVFLSFILIKFLKFIENSFYKKISTKKLRVGDMLGEDIPKLKIYKRLIRGLKKNEIKKIRKIKKYVLIKEGVRFGIVFSITLIITLLINTNLIFWMIL